jgi:hypothetical protein
VRLDVYAFRCACSKLSRREIFERSFQLIVVEEHFGDQYPIKLATPETDIVLPNIGEFSFPAGSRAQRP